MLFILLQNIPLNPGHGVHTGLGPEGAALLPVGWVPWDGGRLVLEQVGRDVGLEVCLLRGPGGHWAPSPPGQHQTGCWPPSRVSIQPKGRPLGSAMEAVRAGSGRPPPSREQPGVGTAVKAPTVSLPTYPLDAFWSIQDLYLWAKNSL